MEDKQTIKILMELVKKYPLTVEEKEAVSNAVGILSWTALSASRIKGLKAKRDKDKEV